MEVISARSNCLWFCFELLIYPPSGLSWNALTRLGMSIDRQNLYRGFETEHVNFEIWCFAGHLISVVLHIFWLVLLNFANFHCWNLLKFYHQLFHFSSVILNSSSYFSFPLYLLGFPTFLCLSLCHFCFFQLFLFYLKSIQCLHVFLVVLTPKHFVVVATLSCLMVGFWDHFNVLLGLLIVF